MAANLATERKRLLEESIVNFRADTVKELSDMTDEYAADLSPWHNTFQFLEHMNIPDRSNKSKFEAMVAANKKVMRDASDRMLAALDAMERDMRAGYDKFEQRVREEGEPSDGNLPVVKGYSLRDYYARPAM